MNYRLIINVRHLAALAILIASISANAAENDPRVHYMIDGSPVSPWSIVIGDNAQWYYPVEGDEQTSKDKAVKVVRSNQDGKAIIQIQWGNKSKSGAFYLSGPPIDLKAFEEKIGVAMDIRLDSKLKQPLTLSLDCGYPCRGSINLTPILNAFPQGEWVTLPIPLKCFSAQGTDLSKVDSPFHLQANGKLKLSLSNVKLAQIPDDFPLCK